MFCPNPFSLLACAIMKHELSPVEFLNSVQLCLESLSENDVIFPYHLHSNAWIHPGFISEHSILFLPLNCLTCFRGSWCQQTSSFSICTALFSHLSQQNALRIVWRVPLLKWFWSESVSMSASTEFSTGSSFLKQNSSRIY